ncbi:MAG: CHRD domain-containing protein [Ardenticatenales bacterium]|nr:CHRD domain-containing protein [Ardenticatenales bacterium]
MISRNRLIHTRFTHLVVPFSLFLLLFLLAAQARQVGQAQAVALPASQCVSFSFTLSGAEEVPPNGSPATGNGVVVIDTVLNQLSYNISYAGLQGTETAAHIHGFAPPGTNAGILYPLPAGNPKIGSITYTEDQEANLLAGLSYVNIHTTAFPGGEIRGQIDDPLIGCGTPTPTPTPQPTMTPTPPPCDPTAVNVTYNPLTASYATGDTGKYFRIFLYNPTNAQTMTLFQTNLPACYTNTINTAFNVPQGLYACAFLYDTTTQNLTLDCTPN